MIGLIGYGMVGKAVEAGFSKTKVIYSDPRYNTVTVEDICKLNPSAIFVCVPTPTDDTDYSTLRDVLDKIKELRYSGLTVVKSTVLPKYLNDYDVLYNPEFLSRATANEDFINPPMLIIGGQPSKAEQLLEIYRTQSRVNLNRVFITTVANACMAKYCMNSFYATKVTFMNQMYDVSKKVGADWQQVNTILRNHPWMGTHHFDVPGPDGSRGFGGPCLPKDTEALVKEFDVELLKKVLEINSIYRT
jgi:nucleotide sugar dehydrogenase